MFQTLRRAVLASLTAAVLMSSAPAFAQGDPKVIERIIDEGKNNSRVWLYLEYLCGEIGPRLTGSARLERANRWALEQFEHFGLTNAHLHEWGTIPVRFDRGPSYAKMVAPVERDFEFTTRSWTAGTDGPVRGRVVKQPENMEQLEAMKDDLKGAWVLARPITRGARRGVAGDAAGGTPTNPTNPNAPQQPGGERPAARQPAAPAQDSAAALWDAMKAAGAVGRIVSSTSDIVTTSGSFRDLDYDNLPTDISVTVRRSDYDAINSRLNDGEIVEVEIDLNHKFTRGPIPVYNTIAEIRGTEFPDEVVIISAHIDSWDGPGSQGAQDNGTGTSVTIEAARILAAVGVQPRRTIRFCLWSGEEQGLLGSRAYVESLTEEERAKISAVFVDDGGTNYQGGLVCVADMEPMLAAAVAPVNQAFPEMPVEILVRNSMPAGGASDHASFNRVGIPGFFWEERGRGGREGKNYRYVWHTQNDIPRYAVPEYLVQSATCSAITAYNLAMADTLLPRYVAPQRRPTAEEDTRPFTPTPGPITGTWVATMIRDGVPSDFTFTYTIEHSAEGRMRGRMYSRFGTNPMRAIAYNSDTKELTFRIESEMGSSTYALKLTGEDELNGTMTREGGDPIVLKATRETLDIRPPEGAEADNNAEGRAGGSAAQGQGQRPRGGAAGGAAGQRQRGGTTGTGGAGGE